MSIPYKQTYGCEVGRPRTITVDVLNADGAPMNDLSTKAYMGLASRDGQPAVTLQVNVAAGTNRMYAVLSAAQNTTKGRWKARLYVGESAGLEELLWEAAFAFDAVDPLPTS